MAEPETWKQRFGMSVGICAIVWVVLLGAVALDPRVHAASLKAPHAIRAEAPPPPRTQYWDGRPRGSEDIPLSDLSKEHDFEQIHLALAGDGAMFVSWATGEGNVVDNASVAAALQDLNRTHHACMVQYGVNPDALDKVVNGVTQTYVQHYPNANYVSGVLHHAKLEGLLPLTTYYYRCGDGRTWGRLLNFTTLQAVGPDAFPQRFGIVGDLGQTQNSSVTLRHLTETDPPIVILVGDYSYADNYLPEGTRRHNYSEPRSSYHPRWDSWGRFVEPLVSRVPLMGIGGNHEEEPDSEGIKFQAYEARFRYPYQESGSSSPHFYSFDVAGVHWVMIGAYVPYKKGSAQYKWLRADLAAVDRARTPWLIVVTHPPWYNTYVAHFKECECMRLELEPVLYEFGVDVVFTGHVHAYERHNRVYDYQVNRCAPSYVTIGDGGNIEALYVEFVDVPEEGTGKDLCPPDNVTTCPTYQDGDFCPRQQPAWSAYREPSFGMGVLEVKSATEAEWIWHRNQNSTAVVGDRVTFTRGDPACAGRRRGLLPPRA